jgi:hypothetical protein
MELRKQSQLLLKLSWLFPAPKYRSAKKSWKVYKCCHSKHLEIERHLKNQESVCIDFLPKENGTLENWFGKPSCGKSFS